MQLNTLALVFICFWLGAVGLTCLGILMAGFAHAKDILEHGFPLPVLIPFGMFLFGYLMTILGFKAESSKSKIFLAALLEGEEVEYKLL